MQGRGVSWEERPIFKIQKATKKILRGVWEYGLIKVTAGITAMIWQGVDDKTTL